MFASRMDSFPLPSGDLLEILRLGNDPLDPLGEDLLDFPNLEWIISQHEDGAPQQQGPPITTDAPESRHSGNHGSSPFDFNMAAMPGLKAEQQSSSAETGDMFGMGSARATQAAVAAASHAAQAAVAASNAFTRVSQDGSASGDEATETHGRHGPPKKKRTRNADQMAQNRVAQQKYRERKKAEHEQLQNALDQLTAQLAAMKAMEAQATALRNHNAALESTVNAQAERITELSIKVDTQSAELVASKKEATAATALAANQQKMILDQHSKLQLQEEVIEALRGRLRDKMEDAFGSQDPKTVCQRMSQAVRTALEGATNVEGLQESLAQLPDHMVTQICCSILCEVKNTWPELGARFHALTGGAPCSQEARAF